MIEKLAPYFNLTVLKTKGFTLLIEHAPCCILSFAAGFIGIAALNHNPLLELGFALGGALIGEHIGHKYFSKNHEHKGIVSNLKRYGLAISFGLASWGVHQTFFHDNHDNHPSEQHQACDHREHSDIRPPSFASPALQEQIDSAHQRLHASCSP